MIQLHQIDMQTATPVPHRTEPLHILTILTTVVNIANCFCLAYWSWVWPSVLDAHLLVLWFCQPTQQRGFINQLQGQQIMHSCSIQSEANNYQVLQSDNFEIRENSTFASPVAAVTHNQQLALQRLARP